MKPLRALSYYGGKNAISNTMVGKWICDQLPWNPSSAYIEPFAGMLGVLLQRAPTRYELVNDLNKDLINWWFIIRDHRAEFEKKLNSTPLSRELYNMAKESLREEYVAGLDRAVWYHIVASQGINNGSGAWRPMSVYKNSVKPNFTQLLPRLQQRLKHVFLECKCALEIIDKYRIADHVVMYLDPPYESANVIPYGGYTVDFTALREMLLQKDTRAKIAISGYGDSYDVLGWERHEKEVRSYGQVQKDFDEEKRKDVERVEVLWTNYSTKSVITPLFNQE